MNKNRIDKIGVACVVEYFCRMGYIDPHINYDDKVPVWDGNIDIHKTEDGNSKEDIDFNLYVQVKSSECKSNDFKTYISHSVNIHDLELYKNNGGTLLIKVLVNEDKAQPYFAYLGKVQINRLISDINETQKTKDVRCDKAPKEYKELYSQLHSIYLQRKHNLIALDDLKDKEGWTFNITTGPISKDTNPLDWFATNNTDVLVKLPGFAEQFYLSEGPVRIFTNHKDSKTVSVEGVEYFKEVNIGNNQKGHIIFIDNFLICQFDDFAQGKQKGIKVNIKITPTSKYVDEYLMQLRFLNAIFEHKYFNIGDIRFDATLEDVKEIDINILKAEIQFWERVTSLYEYFGLNSHFDFKNLDKEDLNKLVLLTKIYNGEKIKSLPVLEEPCSCFQIGEYNICLGVKKSEECGYAFYDINNCASYRECERTHKILKFPVCSYLFKNGIFPDNLNYSDLVTEYKKYEVNEDYLMLANNDVLHLIAKFDSTNNKKFINAAKDIIEWIIMVNVDENSNHIYRMNMLQIYYRIDKPFSDEDGQFLLSINKYNSNQLNFAASVLLKEPLRAQSNYKELTDEEKCEIKELPIYSLYKKLNNN